MISLTKHPGSLSMVWTTRGMNWDGFELSAYNPVIDISVSCATLILWYIDSGQRKRQWLALQKIFLSISHELVAPVEPQVFALSFSPSRDPCGIVGNIGTIQSSCLKGEIAATVSMSTLHGVRSWTTSLLGRDWLKSSRSMVLRHAAWGWMMACHAN